MGINIALDGPSGAGKSTIAKAIAKKLEYVYVDTGALYRAIALYMIKINVDVKSEEQVTAHLDNVNVKLKYMDGEQRVILNGEDVSDLIRTPEISIGASDVSAISSVRTFLFDLQQDIARKNNIIMDGRDIGTVVLPNANVKIFLTATPEERANRRFKELQEKGDTSTYQEVLDDIIKRDYNDSHREIAPLKMAEDGIEVDSTELSLEQAVEKITEIIIKRTTPKKSARFRELMPIQPVERNKPIKLWIKIVYRFIRICIWTAFKICYSLKYVGRENCPKDGSNLVASTHRSYADPVFLAIPTRIPYSFMAKEELFQGNKFFKGLITFLGAFPIKRGNGDSTAIEKSLEELNKGRNLLIFAEGTRSKDGTVGKIKSGVALVGAVAQVPIIPCAICFKDKLKFRRKVIVAFGPPIIPKDIGVIDTTPKSLKILKNKISEEINKLVDENVNKL
ncbi:MAG: (d)CMP kinase [Clostridiales bacterium]|nr:(d)CMP kinase [Clostridiales bacterium]